MKKKFIKKMLIICAVAFLFTLLPGLGTNAKLFLSFAIFLLLTFLLFRKSKSDVQKKEFE